MLLYPADAEPPLVEFELELLFVALAATGPTEAVAPADAGGFKLAAAVADEFDTWSAGSCSGTVGNVNIADFFLSMSQSIFTKDISCGRNTYNSMYSTEKYNFTNINRCSFTYNGTEYKLPALVTGKITYCK